MDTIKKYRNNIKKMFLISIKNDIKNWTDDKNDYFSPYYKTTRLCIDTDRKTLYINSVCGTYEKIIKYRKFIFIIDYDIWKCAKILKNF